MNISNTGPAIPAHASPCLPSLEVTSAAAPATQSELVSIQLLRALASVLVILTHLQIKERQYGDLGSLIWQDFEIGRIGVDIFFVLSGFIIFYVAGNIERRAGAAFAFLRHRIIRIIPLYWALTLIALAIYLTMPELVNKSSKVPVDIAASFLLYPTSGKLLILNGWTLSYEFLFYACFFVAILLFAPARRAYFVVAVAALAALTGYIGQPTGTVSSFVTQDLVLEFALGLIIGALYCGGSAERLFRPWLGGIIFLLGALAIGWMGHFPESITLGRGLAFGLPSAALLFGALCLERQLSSLRGAKILGDSSYSLYLLHVLSLPAIGMFWRQLGFEGALGNLGLLLAMLLGSIASSIVLFKFFELPTTRWLRRKYG